MVPLDALRRCEASIDVTRAGVDVRTSFQSASMAYFVHIDPA